MSKQTAFTTKVGPAVRHASRRVVQKQPIQLWLAAILGGLLLAAPRTRVVFGAPIYFIDILAGLLLILPLHGQVTRWVPKNPFASVVLVYFGTVLISEFRGMIEYGVVMEPIYMMLRYALAISLFYTIPRLISRSDHIDLILKGLMLGTLFSAVVGILYSLGPTRSLVIDLLFSNSYLNPSWKRMLEIVAIFGANETAMRGRSLVGAATMTAGFLGVTWPIAFITYNKLKDNFLWGKLALVTIILAPIAILMTYGRGAWVIVGTVIFLVAIFNLAGARRILLMTLIVATVTATQVKIDSDLFYFDRIFGEAQVTIENPFEDNATTERLFSFVEPFDHLLNNPAWLLAGAGQSGNKMRTRGDLKEQLYDEIGLATHSAFAKSYYNFGVVAAICQIVFVLTGFRLIIKRVFKSNVINKEQQLIWQSLLMSWCTYTLWWGSGHGMVGEPRGVMLSFILFSLLLAFEKLRIIEITVNRTGATGSEI